jgi:hypothetical protein
MSDPRSIALPSLLVGPPPELLLIRSLSNYLAQPFDNRDLGGLTPRSLLDEQPIRATLHYGNIQTRRALRQGLDQPGPDRREPATALAGGRRTAWGDGSWRSTDEGVSGARRRDKRPGLDALLKGRVSLGASSTSWQHGRAAGHLRLDHHACSDKGWSDTPQFGTPAGTMKFCFARSKGHQVWPQYIVAVGSIG